MKNIKKYLFFVSLLFVVLFLSFLLNMGLGPNLVLAIEVELPGLGQNPSIPQYVSYIFNFVMQTAGVLALLSIVLGAIHYLVSLGMGKITSEGKEWVKSGVLGLILLLSSWLIMNTINPDLISFKASPLLGIPFPTINIPPIPAKQPPTIVFNEIPIGSLTENLLTRTIDCYDFDLYGDPIDGDLTTNILEPTFENHDRVDCLLKLAEATERKTESFKKLSEQLASLMDDCSCKDPSTSGSIGYFFKNGEYDFESKIFGVLLASDFTTDIYTPPKGELYNATYITATSANFEGKIIDDGGGDCWFRFKWKKTTDSQWQEGQWYGSYRTGNYFSVSTANLEPNTSYEFTVEIKNAEQSSGYLPSKTFKTLLLAKPAAELSDATNITADSATLNGKITDDGGDACQYQFKWRKTGDSQWTLGGWNGSLRTGAGFNQNISGLESNTSYEFTAEVKNKAGVTILTIKRFTTKSIIKPVKPAAELSDATNITAASATLNGKITDDGGDACQYQFKWRKTGDSQWTLGGWSGSLRTGAGFNQNISGLEPNTSYEFTAEVKNSAGISGELTIKTFTTRSVGEPAGEIFDATYITATSANFEGKIIDDGGGDCWFRFKWKKTTDSQWQEGQWYGSYRTGNYFSVNTANLEPNTSYEFTVEIKNAAYSSGYLPSKTFKTLSVSQPAAELFDATNITAASATLNGKITNDGGEYCQYQFQWRKAGDSQWTLGGWYGSLRTGAGFNQNISGLESNTSYEFTAEVKNKAGSSGVLTPKTFTTPSATGLGCEVYGAGNITTASANLSGKVIGDGGEYCQYQFQWRKDGDSQWTPGGWSGSLRTGNIFGQNLSGLAANTTYNYMAEIKNSRETVACVFKKLGPPLGLKAVALDTTLVFVSWVKGYGAENTMVRRDKDKCPEKPTDGVLVYSGPAESFVNTGLTPNTVYCYVAWSIIGTTYSDPSNPAYVTTEKPSICITTKCPDCGRGWTRKTPCPENSPCPEKCPACGCPSGSPSCAPCPPGVKDIIEYGPITLDACGGSKTYKGLDEFRSQHTNMLDVVEIEVMIKEEKVKIIKKDVWDKLRLIDQLKYLKEKLSESKGDIESDLNLLEIAEDKIGKCYLIKSYVEFLKIAEKTDKKDAKIVVQKIFKDPITNKSIDASKYCKGFGYADASIFNACKKICSPGANLNSFDALRNLYCGGDLDCIAEGYYLCGGNNFGYEFFQDCLVDMREKCKDDCEKKYSGCPDLLQKCRDLCDEDSSFLDSLKAEKCYVDLEIVQECAWTYSVFEDFKRCTQSSMCVYSTDQYAGYPDCLTETTPSYSDYSALYFYQNPTLQKDYLSSFFATIIGKSIVPPVYPESQKCPFFSKCPQCPCENDKCTKIEKKRLFSNGDCSEYAYDGDPLTFYCRTDWWQEAYSEIGDTADTPSPEDVEFSKEATGIIKGELEVEDEPTGLAEPLTEDEKNELLQEEGLKTPFWAVTMRCPRENEIPIGQTVDEAEAWPKELLKQIDDFIGKTENMIQYIKKIGEEKNYCKCNSICQPGEPTCKIECEYKTTEVEYQDPDTDETVHYYVCYCLQHPCDGNPCQKMINMLRGKAASDKCPKGTEYRGVAWYAEKIREAFEILKELTLKSRSEILKKLIYSRNKINECSALSGVFKGETSLISCTRIKDYNIDPISTWKTIIQETPLRGFCYGQWVGRIFEGEPLMDNWGCCEPKIK